MPIISDQATEGEDRGHRGVRGKKEVKGEEWRVRGSIESRRV